MPISAIAKIAIMVAATAAQYALSASQKIKGPRLDSLDADLASYGAAIPRCWGISRIACQTIHAEKLKERKKTSKSAKGGGKMTEYKYFGTWAALITDVEIDDVLRIQMDKRVVYDAGGVGPVGPVLGLFEGPLGLPVKLAEGHNLRLYNGTQDQLPDPRYVAWCEDRYGRSDVASAWRGSAYLFFEDIPLEKFGNRIPQVEVQVLRNASTVFPYETHPFDVAIDNPVFSPDFQKLLLKENSAYEIWDVPTRTRTVAGTFPISIPGAVGVGIDGTIWGITGAFGPDNIVGFGGDGLRTETAVPIPTTFPGGVQVIQGELLDGTPTDVVCVLCATHQLVYFGLDTAHSDDGGAVVIDIGFRPASHFRDSAKNLWVAGWAGSSDVVGFYCFFGARAGEGATFSSPTGFTNTTFRAAHDGEKFVCAHGGEYFFVDDQTFTPTTPVTVSGTSNGDQFSRIQPGDKSFWTDVHEISLADFSTIRAISLASYATGFGTFAGSFFDRINRAIINCNPDDLVWYYVDRRGSPGTPLGDIVQEVSDWSGIEGIDVSKLTQTVPGYISTAGSGRDMLDPLLTIHDVDARPHDFIIDFLPRGQAPQGALVMARYGRDGDKPRHLASRKQGVDLPLMVTISFADPARDLQRNSVTSRRAPEATKASREELVDMSTYSATPDEAQQLCDRYFRRIWNSRDEASLILTAQRLAAEPGDVWTVPLDDEVLNMRIDRMTVRGLAIDVSFIRDEEAVAVLNAASVGAPMAGTDPTSVFVPSSTNGFAIDAPLRQDGDNDVNPLIYTAAGPYSLPWAGAVMFRGDDGTFDEEFDSFESSEGSTWGYCITQLATADPNLWDRGNSLDVVIYNGTLTSKTEAQINANRALNQLAIGTSGRWEYVQFATATLTGTSGTGNAYTLTGLKRGRRGTEANVGNHQTGDAIIVMASASGVRLGVDELGAAMRLKAVSVGRDPDMSAPIALTYQAATLKPYAPCQFRARLDDGTGDWVFSWMRRTRIGGAWSSSGATIPLAENSEAYEVAIPVGGGEYRTIAAAAPTATWTAAQQTADLGAPQTGLPSGVAVYQMSDAIGRGFASPEPIAA